jgi:hypothetical protein
VCARCAEVALTVACHPTFRPAAPLPVTLSRGATDSTGVRGALGRALGLCAWCLACSFVWLELLDAAAVPLLLLAAWLASGLPHRAFIAPGDAAARATWLLLFGLATICGALLIAPRAPARALALGAYIAWYSTADKGTHRGDRAWPLLRRLALWRPLAQGLGVRLHKTGDLDPDTCHVIAYSPVGHVSAATVLAFGAPDAAGWAAAYPGVDTRIAAPAPGCGALSTPLLREAVLAMGVCAGSEAAMCDVIAEAGATQPDGVPRGLAVVAVVPVVGGVTAIVASPTAYDAATVARKRLARVALRTGATLVPAFGFGDLHDVELTSGEQAQPSISGAITAAVRRSLGIQLPLVPGPLAPLAAFLSRHVMTRLDDTSAPAKALNSLIGAMAWQRGGQAARRARIVVGRPIPCVRVSHPSDALVDDVAFKLWRETATLVAAHVQQADED